jgi:hypothetical protein
MDPHSAQRAFFPSCSLRRRSAAQRSIAAPARLVPAWLCHSIRTSLSTFSCPPRQSEQGRVYPGGTVLGQRWVWRDTMEIKTVDASAIFRAGFTACPTDPRTLIVDVRDKKQFDKGHISGAYCIRLPSSGNVLLGECQGSGACWQRLQTTCRSTPPPARRRYCCHRRRRYCCHRRRREQPTPPSPRCLLQTTPRASTT